MPPIDHSRIRRQNGASHHFRRPDEPGTHRASRSRCVSSAAEEKMRKRAEGEEEPRRGKGKAPALTNGLPRLGSAPTHHAFSAQIPNFIIASAPLGATLLPIQTRGAHTPVATIPTPSHHPVRAPKPPSAPSPSKCAKRTHRAPTPSPRATPSPTTSCIAPAEHGPCQRPRKTEPTHPPSRQAQPLPPHPPSPRHSARRPYDVPAPQPLRPGPARRTSGL
jgi:hypothetical protein